MSLMNLFEKASLSRRSLLKGLTAVVGTAAVAGCASDDDNEQLPIVPKQDVVFEQADRTAFNTGPFNCGSKCVHKFHVKNDRIFAMTSAGDIPRSESSKDEWANINIGEPMQYRSCVRGFSYIQRVYQPDRLKYPLLQTGEKGNLATFKRISWEEAAERIGKAMKAAFDKASILGYVPVVDRMGFVAGAAKAKGLTYIAGRSNASNGNSEAAKMDSVGTSMMKSSKSDNLNSKFIVFWGCDPTRHSNHENGSYWAATKAKEANVPIVTVSPVCTDNAAMHSTSVVVSVPALAGVSAAKTVKIPGWIGVRPGTDGALIMAMMYVIYRRKLYDATMLDNSSVEARKCFGFWKGDTVTSVAPEVSRSGFPFEYPYAANGKVAGAKFKGETFTVPANESMEEVLMNLENTVANGGWCATGATSGISSKDISYDPSVHATQYSEVLNYASRLTGVKADLIEAFACHYATTVSKIDGGQGPQRQHGGAEWVWLIISLSTMCGHADRKGGGLGIGMGSHPENNVFGTKANKVTNGTGFVYNLPRKNVAGGFTDSYINVMDQNLAEVVLTGRDKRTVAQFQRDNQLSVNPAATGSALALAATGVQVDMYTMSASNRLITHSNINKTIEAYKKIPMVVVCDQVMTPSAAYADIVLPAATHLEDVGGVGGQGDILIYKQNVLRKTMYESKRQAEINNIYLRACATAVGTTPPAPYVTPADLDGNVASKTNIENRASTNLYDAAVGQPATIGGWDEFTKTGRIQIVVPQDKPIIGLVHHFKPGQLETSTGYINFWSPFWGVARRSELATVKTQQGGFTDYSAGWRTPVAKYVPVREGYERFFNGSNPNDVFTGFESQISGRKYGLQFMTNKARNRAHTCQDNVAIIKDQFEQKVYMNPIDAASRFINDGDYVYVYNDRGCTKIRAAVTHYIVPGVISVEHGAWYRASTDPKETVKVWLEHEDSSLSENQANYKIVPVDLGGSENLLTDDLCVYDPIFINQTASCHGGPVEVSKTKPE